MKFIFFLLTYSLRYYLNIPIEKPIESDLEPEFNFDLYFNIDLPIDSLDDKTNISLEAIKNYLEMKKTFSTGFLKNSKTYQELLKCLSSRIENKDNSEFCKDDKLKLLLNKFKSKNIIENSIIGKNTFFSTIGTSKLGLHEKKVLGAFLNEKNIYVYGIPHNEHKLSSHDICLIDLTNGTSQTIELKLRSNTSQLQFLDPSGLKDLKHENSNLWILIKNPNKNFNPSTYDGYAYLSRLKNSHVNNWLNDLINKHKNKNNIDLSFIKDKKVKYSKNLFSDIMKAIKNSNYTEKEKTNLLYRLRGISKCHYYLNHTFKDVSKEEWIKNNFPEAKIQTIESEDDDDDYVFEDEDYKNIWAFKLLDEFLNDQNQSYYKDHIGKHIEEDSVIKLFDDEDIKKVIIGKLYDLKNEEKK